MNGREGEETGRATHIFVIHIFDPPSQVMAPLGQPQGSLLVHPEPPLVHFVPAVESKKSPHAVHCAGSKPTDLPVQAISDLF